MQKKGTKTRENGFTIIELVVTFAMLAIVFGITIGQGRGSQEPMKVINEAYNVALFIKEAQTLATQVGTEATYEKGVGVYYAGGSQSQLLMYVDDNQNNEYDSGEENIVSNMPKLVLKDNIVVSGSCVPAGSCGTSALHISFRRPLVNAIFAGPAGASTAADVALVVSGPGGSITQNVRIDNAGFISVP